MFAQWMAQMGIGSAKVDAKLDEWQFQPGQTLSGTIHIRGGKVAQVINDIVLELTTQYHRNNKKETYVFKRYPLSIMLEIEPDQERKIPFEIKLPSNLPISTGRFPIYLRTVLDIKNAVDPIDTDRIEVFPPPLIANILKQIEDNGFILYQIENMYDSNSKLHPFFQCFIFRPTGSFQAYIDQFNIMFDHNDHSITIDMEMVRADQALGSRFYWEHEDPTNTLTINGEKVEEDPFDKLNELFQRR